MRGQRNEHTTAEAAEEQRLRDETLIFWGRQQSELEHYASQKAIEPMALAARLGELWLHYSGQWNGERMPGLSPERHSVATRNAKPRHPALATKEGDHRSHDNGARLRKNAKATVNAAPGKVDKRLGNNAGWGRFKTAAARRKEMHRRLLLRTDPLAKVMRKGLLKEGLKDKKAKAKSAAKAYKAKQAKNKTTSELMKAYWASMTPAQRKKENDRRQALRMKHREEKKAAASTPTAEAA